MLPAWSLPLAMLATLELRPEHQRPDPFGGVVEADRGATAALAQPLRTARASYVSFHAVVKLDTPGAYELAVSAPAPLAADVFREWFHLGGKDKHYTPDALVPVTSPYRSALPEPDNRIAKQTAQAFWIDVWATPETPPGSYRVTVTLSANGTRQSVPVEIRVTPATVPTEDVVTMDHNSYGTSFLVDQYPKLAARHGDGFVTSDAFFNLIHAYHRIFYEHRGVFHQLGYGHGGKVAPEFAPALTGHGRSRKIASWDLYDRHFGPLLDGSAFRATRRGAKPIPFLYLPINPEWPASFVSWGERGYETEFVNVVGEMERHFREKGWTQTRFELFFNHKKRYKAFPWDGDEVRFLGDDRYFKEYARLMAKATGTETPVKFVFRTDASWALEQQFTDLAGIINFWVCSGGIASWNRPALRRAVNRGDIVWFYGGPPEVSKPAAEITGLPLRAWLWGIHGFVHWLTVSAGADPWFQFDGGGTALVYPGERFGIEGPIPSVRLKIQRNALQDLALAPREAADAIAGRFNGSQAADWWAQRPALADRPPEEWSNDDVDEAVKPSEARLRKADAASWQRVREWLLEKQQ
ncbi:MAG: DUF4091 domain-containing protein [Bryobacterales bacterium]|nr:DUF4091 domain-containing protein [Bryobacterales bacterium]